MELLLTGDFIDANTALSWGLLNRVAPMEKLDEEVKQLADSILAKSSVAVSTGKKMFYKQLESKMEDVINFVKKEIKEGITKGQTTLQGLRKQQIEVGKELDEANSRLNNAKEKLNKKDQLQDTRVLTPKEKKDTKEENSSKKTNAGIIEAASIVVGSLKSKLTTTQKELEEIQVLLEEEREAHKKTREELMKIKSKTN